MCTHILRKIPQQLVGEEAFVILRISCAKYHYATDVHAVLHPFSKLSFAVDHTGERGVCMFHIRVHKYAHAQSSGQRQNARARYRAYNRETYDGMCSSGKLRTVFPTVAYEVLLPKAQEGKMEGRRETEASFTEVELSRAAFGTRFLLDFTSNSFARDSKTRPLDFFRENAVRLFAICVCARVPCIYACTYRAPFPPRPQFIRDKSGESNAISRIEFSSGAEKIWVGESRAWEERQSECQLKKKLRLDSTEMPLYKILVKKTIIKKKY